MKMQGGGGHGNTEQKEGRDLPHLDHAVSFDSHTLRLATAAATLPASEPTATVKDTQ